MPSLKTYYLPYLGPIGGKLFPLEDPRTVDRLFWRSVGSPLHWRNEVKRRTEDMDFVQGLLDEVEVEDIVARCLG